MISRKSYKEHENIRSFQGRFPVIYLTFKDVKHQTWDECYETFKLLLGRGATFCRLKIPNKEVRFVYNEIIQFWVSKGVQATDYRLMLRSLTEGDIETFGKIFRDVVKKSFSYFDVGGERA